MESNKATICRVDYVGRIGRLVELHRQLIQSALGTEIRANERQPEKAHINIDFCAKDSPERPLGE